MKQKPDLSFWKLWNLSFGFFGVQIAYALQSANISRIFATLGADPHNLRRIAKDITDGLVGEEYPQERKKRVDADQPQ